MITRIRQRLFSLNHPYNNPLDIQRAQLLLYLNIAVVVVTLLTVFLLQIPTAMRGEFDVTGAISSVVVIVAAFASYQLIQRGRLNLAIWIMVLAITLGTLSAIVFGGDGIPSISQTVIVFLPVPIVAAGVLLNRRGLVAITLLTLLAVIVVAIAQSTVAKPIISYPSVTAAGDLAAIVISIISIFVVLIAFLGRLQRLVGEAFEMGRQRQWVNLVALELGTIQTEPELLNTAISQSRQIFNRRSVDIYLVNEDGYLTNASTNGQRRTTIRSIDASIVAEAARSRTLLMTSMQDDPARRSHMAASASYAAANPLLVGTELLGVLDCQGSRPFSQNELDTFVQLAGQIALAIQRVRKTSELAMQVLDHEKTISRLQNQMQEFDRRQRQTVSDVWGGYIEGRGRQAIGYNLDGSASVPVQATDLPSGLVATLKSGLMEVSTEGNEQIINVPIRFRDTNLGAMSFAVPADQPLSERQIEVATTVAERLALALENTRLFEQSASQALRERKASEVATALIGATDVRVVLNMAAEQFKDALGAVNTRIYIQPETLMEPLAQTQQEN